MAREITPLAKPFGDAILNGVIMSAGAINQTLSQLIGPGMRSIVSEQIVHFRPVSVQVVEFVIIGGIEDIFEAILRDQTPLGA